MDPRPYLGYLASCILDKYVLSTTAEQSVLIAPEVCRQPGRLEGSSV